MSLKIESYSKLKEIKLSEYGYLDGEGVGISISFIGEGETFVINEFQARQIIEHLKEQFGI